MGMGTSGPCLYIFFFFIKPKRRRLPKNLNFFLPGPKRRRFGLDFKIKKKTLPSSSPRATSVSGFRTCAPQFPAEPGGFKRRSCLCFPASGGANAPLRSYVASPLPGPHVFRDATIPISFVGPHVVEFLISQHTRISAFDSFFNKAISGCSGADLTALLGPAIASGNANLVSDLIDAGAVVNRRDSDSGSLLSLGVRTGNVEIVKVLIASGCGIGNSANMVLHDAAAMNRVDLFEILCKSFTGIDVNCVDPDGRTPIHIAAAHGHVEMLKYCISVGGNAEVSDSKGWNPLHSAAEKGHLEAAKCLLTCSKLKYAVTKDGRTAFDLAATNGHSCLLGCLRYDDVLHRAARLDDAHGIKSCLAEGADANGRDQNGWTPLHRAAFKGRIECVKVLLNHGALVDAVDDVGYMPLHCATEAGHLQVALLLVAHGARANVKSLEGIVHSNFDRLKNHPAVISHNENNVQLKRHCDDISY